MNEEIHSFPIKLENPSLQNVLKIAEEILSKKKMLNVEYLYKISKKRLKLPHQGLSSIIQYLLNQKILVPGSRYTKKSVLLNPYRKRIYTLIKTQLGVHFSVIRKKVFSNRESNIGSSGQLIWHLEMLLKFNYIKKVKIKNYTIFLPKEVDEELGLYYFYLREKINNRIIKFLIKVNSAKKSDIYKALNEERVNVYYRINNLIDNDIISLKEGNNKEICVNPAKREYIAKILKNISKNKI